MIYRCVQRKSGNERQNRARKTHESATTSLQEGTDIQIGRNEIRNQGCVPASNCLKLPAGLSDQARVGPDATVDEVDDEGSEEAEREAPVCDCREGCAAEEVAATDLATAVVVART